VSSISEVDVQPEVELREVAWLRSEGYQEDYLFEAGEDSEGVFFMVQEELEHLNDFCVLCLQQTRQRVQNLREDANGYRMGKRKASDPAEGDLSDEVAWSIEEVILPAWNELEQVVVRAMCLLLLAAFLEKSLKDIISQLGRTHAPGIRPRTRESKIESALRYLRDQCGLVFDEPAESRDMREICRRVRNEFAHGDWERVKQGLSSIDLADAFGSASELLYHIDRAAARP
jgi:hypothetical protein